MAQHSFRPLWPPPSKLHEQGVRVSGQHGVAVQAAARTLSLVVDQPARAHAARLDGCYVLKTDLPAAVVAKEVVHARYRSLALVEQAFRTSKTVELELRPIHVRLEARTRAHALVVMLAYRLVQVLADRWRALDVTVGEGMAALAQLCAMDVTIGGQTHCAQVPTPRDLLRQLVEATGLTLPAAIPRTGVTVATRKKLQTRRATS